MSAKDVQRFFKEDRKFNRLFEKLEEKSKSVIGPVLIMFYIIIETCCVLFA